MIVCVSIFLFSHLFNQFFPIDRVLLVDLNGRLKSNRNQPSEIVFDFKINSTGLQTNFCFHFKLFYILYFFLLKFVFVFSMSHRLCARISSAWHARSSIQ